MKDIPLIDHIGWDLTRATQAWKSRFTEKMVASGYSWYAGARGTLVPLIGRKGVSQNVLTEKSGLTKQAIQQHLDALEADGIITRTPDKMDARRKHVAFTIEGQEALAVANAVKEEIEAEYSKLLGKEAFQTLQTTLRTLADHKA